MHIMVKFISTIFIVLIIVSLIKGQCSNVYEYGVGTADQQIIIDKHNSLRLLLAQGQVSGQPRACNLQKFKYDAKLAEQAQNIANTCRFEHVLVGDPRWSWVGQNLYQSMSTAFSLGASWDSAIQSWFDEYKDYHYPDDSNSGTGHYTQVAWANTEYVGCGFINFESNEIYPYTKLYVCNYGPGGNIRGEAPYATIVNGNCGCENLCSDMNTTLFNDVLY